jgi:small-conductance mechanosensitive channel
VKKFLEYDIISFSHYHVTVYHLVFLSLVFLVVRIILSFLNGMLKRQVSHGHLDEGSRYAVYQIIKYIVFILGLTVGLESVGVDITILVAGSAALLVGIGLGLQQVFFDLVSGIIILFERTIKVGDIIEVGTRKGTIQSIGIRTSHIMTKEGIMYIIPNSKFLSDAVVNWSHDLQHNIEFTVRFKVAYSSNLEQVQRIIKSIAATHPKIEQSPEPQVRMADFGPDAILLDLEFFTKERDGVGDIQSDIRFAAEKAFAENGIKIPYPKTVD